MCVVHLRIVSAPNPPLPLASPLVAPRCGGPVDRTDFFDGRARVVRPTPVLGLLARLEPDWLDLRTGHDEVALDVAQGERSHPPLASGL
jgi:hypothetical protein